MINNIYNSNYIVPDNLTIQGLFDTEGETENFLKGNTDHISIIGVRIHPISQ